MQPFNHGPGPGVQPQGQAGPMPGYPPMAPPRRQFDLGRIASSATVVAGIVVLFCSLLDLYSITVDPGKVEDSVNGTVEVGMGFYTIVPFNAPVVALAIPILMLVAAVTAIPGALGRRQGALVSAVSAIAATLLALVMMMSNPLPGVSLSGDLESEAAEEFSSINVKSVDQLVDRVVDIGPGAGLIIAFVFGLLASVAAGFAYWRSGGDEPQKPFAPAGPTSGAFAPMHAPQAGPPSSPMPGQQQQPTPGWGPTPHQAQIDQPQIDQPQFDQPPFDATQISQRPPNGLSGTGPSGTGLSGTP
ncbi:hypothetical protein L5G32_17210 [Gordonia sp. HY002]|uniref:hypothetical protein n=1 Tax=Gordonia zhenghanii TaxID=2911516 RepID=UPI001EEF8675|nr:hypothetical protein [Gordonia zhenghanii]MCF8572009.1 hypothetical protein [Gordonia zhenghanii]MCF8606640.1 hypothetical protein [Gordonia zhenghanii]